MTTHVSIADCLETERLTETATAYDAYGYEYRHVECVCGASLTFVYVDGELVEFGGDC